MEGPAPLTGRESELQLIRNALTAALAGRGSLLMLSGPAGIGKTRLLEEAAAEARARGFAVGSGVAFDESLVLYHAWEEALRGLKLDTLLREEPPPRLLALYLVSANGLPVVRAERPGFSEDPALLAMMLNNAGEFLRDAIKPGEGQAEGDLMRMAIGGRGVCIARGRAAALLAVFEGRETEIFLREVRRLLDEVASRAAGRLDGWDGNKRAVADLAEPLRATLLSGRFEGVDLAADGQARKFNLFDNVLFGLRRRAGREPLLIVLDDLQWADPSSLGLLHYIARGTRDASILLIGAFRSEERETRPQLREALAALARDDLSDEVALGRLSAEETKVFAERLLGPNRVGAAFFERLSTDTEGNPLIVREVVSHLREVAAVAADPSDGRLVLTRPLARLEVPGKIRDAVANRVARLEPPDRELLDAAAVCGTRFSGKLLGRLVEDRELAVARRLNAIARRNGLVVPESGAWRFDHPVVREVVYASIPRDLRALLHLEAGQALAEEGGDEAGVAEHFAEAGDPRAVPPLEAAAQAASERGAPLEAARLLEKAVPVAPPAEKARLEFGRAQALELAAHYEEALSSVDAAASLGADPIRCALLRGALYNDQARSQDVLRAVEEALSAAAPPDAGRLLTLRARALISLDRYEEAEQAARRALTLFPEGQPAARASALVPLAAALGYRGHHVPALELLNEALHLRESVSDRRGVCEALMAIGNVEGELGEIQRAVEFLRLALALGEKIGDRRQVAACRLNLANALADLLDLDGAMDEARRAQAAAEAVGNRTMAGWCEFIQGLVLARRGKSHDALIVLDRCARRARAQGELRLLANALAESVQPRLRLRERERAFDDATESLAVARKAQARMAEGFALRALGEVAGAEGRLEEMGQRFAEAEALFGGLRNTTEAAETHVRWADALQAAGRPGEAREHWSAAVRLFEARNLRRRAAAARTALVALPA